jgi:hypothetical protein
VILHVNPVSKLQYILGNILLATLPLILLFRNTLSQGRKERIIPGNPLVHIMDPSESPTQYLGPPKSAIPFKGPFILNSQYLEAQKSAIPRNGPYRITHPIYGTYKICYFIQRTLQIQFPISGISKICYSI